MAAFLAENNVCGQTILQLTSIGNAIISELLRLKDFIPDVFKLETKEEQKKYGELLMNFNYFKISDSQDKKIENDPVSLKAIFLFHVFICLLLIRFFWNLMMSSEKIIVPSSADFTWRSRVFSSMSQI